jgi:hypothetical protein
LPYFNGAVVPGIETGAKPLNGNHGLPFSRARYRFLISAKHPLIPWPRLFPKVTRFDH